MLSKVRIIGSAAPTGTGGSGLGSGQRSGRLQQGAAEACGQVVVRERDHHAIALLVREAHGCQWFTGHELGHAVVHRCIVVMMVERKGIVPRMLALELRPLTIVIGEEGPYVQVRMRCLVMAIVAEQRRQLHQVGTDEEYLDPKDRESEQPAHGCEDSRGALAEA